MSWDKKLVIYILLPILLVVGISYAIHQVAGAGAQTHVENSTAADDPPLCPHVHEPESRPTIERGSWLMMAFVGFAVALAYIFVVETIPRALTRCWRWRKS